MWNSNFACPIIAQVCACAEMNYVISGGAPAARSMRTARTECPTKGNNGVHLMLDPSIYIKLLYVDAVVG